MNRTRVLGFTLLASLVAVPVACSSTPDPEGTVDAAVPTSTTPTTTVPTSTPDAAPDEVTEEGADAASEPLDLEQPVRAATHSTTTVVAAAGWTEAARTASS